MPKASSILWKYVIEVMKINDKGKEVRDYRKHIILYYLIHTNHSSHPYCHHVVQWFAAGNYTTQTACHLVRLRKTWC